MSVVRWSAPARRDLAEIDDYYGSIDSALAVRIGSKLIEAARFLVLHPRAGTLIEHGDFRKWRVTGTPYLLIYRPDGADVRITRVHHVRQGWRDEP